MYINKVKLKQERGAATLALLTAGGGAVVPVAMAVAGDFYGEERRGVALGLIGMVTEAGGVLGPLYQAPSYSVPRSSASASACPSKQVKSQPQHLRQVRQVRQVRQTCLYKTIPGSWPPRSSSSPASSPWKSSKNAAATGPSSNSRSSSAHLSQQPRSSASSWGQR